MTQSLEPNTSSVNDEAHIGTVPFSGKTDNAPEQPCLTRTDLDAHPSNDIKDVTAHPNGHLNGNGTPANGTTPDAKKIAADIITRGHAPAVLAGLVLTDKTVAGVCQNADLDTRQVLLGSDFAKNYPAENLIFRIAAEHFQRHTDTPDGTAIRHEVSIRADCGDAQAATCFKELANLAGYLPASVTNGNAAPVAKLLLSQIGNTAPYTQRPAAFETFSYEDLKNFPRAEWLVRHLVVSGTTGVITGDSMSFKTFFALWMAICIAEGIPFFGNEVKQGPVVYIAAEGFFTLYDRITACCDHLGIEPPKDFHAMQVPVNISEPAVRAAFCDSVRELQPVLIVGDTLSQMAVDLDENSNSDMAQFIRGAMAIALELKATFAILHHNGKTTGIFRGASAIKNNVDFHITIDRPDEDQLVTFVTCAKLRGRPFEPFALQGQEVELPHKDEFGEPITTLVFDATTDTAGVKPRKSKSKSTVKTEKIREALMVEFDRVFAKWGSVKIGTWRAEAIEKRAERGGEGICGGSTFWGHRRYLEESGVIEEMGEGSGLYQRSTLSSPSTLSTPKISTESEPKSADDSTLLQLQQSLDVGVVRVKSAMGNESPALPEMPTKTTRKKRNVAASAEPYKAQPDNVELSVGDY